MSNNYEIKISNHKKLNSDDIREFCIDQAKKFNLDDYVVNLRYGQIGFASYRAPDKLIFLDTDYRKIYTLVKKEFRSKFIIDGILLVDADAFNLYIISAIFHELWHAKQIKEINLNPNSHYSNLIKISDSMRQKSRSSYERHHGSYYIEYDAIINSLIATLNYISKFNIDKRALIFINRDYAFSILSAYGIEPDGNSYDYDSPMDFFKYFISNFYYGEEQREKLIQLENIISYCQSNDDISCLMHGYPISDSFIEKLNDIKTGKIKTTNLLSELYLINENDFIKK